jgi:hypothetical protein
MPPAGVREKVADLTAAAWADESRKANATIA